MTSNEWQQVSAVLAAALERPPAAWPAFLAGTFPHAPHLREEVASLLEAHQAAERSAALASPFAPRPGLSLVGQALGPYRLRAVIGQGGMGSVYRAERVDGQFEQQVAIKLVLPHRATPELLQRFHHERQILARLTHPHIARLLDGGVTDDGAPYLVMEYVDGHPITAYCEAQQLSIPERLTFFCTVCNAVAYAHQNLIVHRDLKPDNIFVAPAGEVKLLDFGIAKVLAEEAPGPTTRTGRFVMTPAYASPEQVRGEAITTATDVYQLGVLLYELLTNRPPFDLKGLSPSAIEQVICTTEPESPSRRVARTADAALAGPLAGDLDTIVAKALRKEPEHRYASAKLLRQDLRRHQQHLPVMARPHTRRYRASRFVRRHRIGVAVGAVVAVLVAVVLVLILRFSLATAAHADALAEERDRAQAEADKAEQINTFLQGMLSAADPAADGRDVRVVDVLGSASATIEETLDDQPAVAAALHRTLGLTYQNLGLYDDSETHLREALALRQTHLPTLHTDRAQSLKDLGLVFHWQGRLDSARTYYLQGLERFRAIGARSVGYAEALNDYGTLLLDEARFAEADELFREALSIYREMDTADESVVAALNNRALAMHSLHRLPEADSLYQEMLALQQQVMGPTHPDVAVALGNLAWLRLEREDRAGADSLFRASLALRRATLGDAHPSVGLMQTHIAGQILLPEGQYSAADSLIRAALTLFADVVPGDHLYTSVALHTLGLVQHRSGDLAAAEETLRSVHAMRTRLYGEAHRLLAPVEMELGAVLLRQERFSEATALLQSALALTPEEDQAQADSIHAHLAKLPRIALAAE